MEVDVMARVRVRVRVRAGVRVKMPNVTSAEKAARRSGVS